MEAREGFKPQRAVSTPRPLLERGVIFRRGSQRRSSLFIIIGLPQIKVKAGRNRLKKEAGFAHVSVPLPMRNLQDAVVSATGNQPATKPRQCGPSGG